MQCRPIVLDGQIGQQVPLKAIVEIDFFFQILESTIELMISKLEQRVRIFLSLKIQVAQCDCDFLHSNPMNSV